MKLMRIALTGSLLLFLAACGGDGPINPPTTTGTTTDGTTTGTTTGGTTGFPSTTGGTTGGTTGFPSTTGGTTGFPSTTGGTTGTTTGGSTTGGTTTGGTTTGGGTGSISGTVFAPSGSSAAGETIVLACYPTGDAQAPCDDTLSLGLQFSAGSSFPYVIDGLSAGQYAVIAISDADGNGSVEDEGDFLGIYPSFDGAQPVTPPATGIDFAMVVASSLGTASVTPEFKLSDAFISKILGN